MSSSPPAIVRRPRARRMAIDVLPFDDIGPDELLERLESMIDARERRLVAAMHVTSLTCRADTEFTTALARSDLVYGDGYSVILAARRFGAHKARRVATTDLFRQLGSVGAFRRLAIIGGEPGVAEAAGEHCEREYGCSVVFSTSGYHTNWSTVLEELTRAQPDLVLIGMGMPLESKWLDRHYEQLPDAVHLTCGGMLRIIAGTERRAPTALRAARLEWLYRLLTNPSRTWRRYLLGAGHLAVLLSKRTTGWSPRSTPARASYS